MIREKQFLHTEQIKSVSKTRKVAWDMWLSKIQKSWRVTSHKASCQKEQIKRIPRMIFSETTDSTMHNLRTHHRKLHYQL